RSRQPRLRPTLRVPRLAPADGARLAARARFGDDDFLAGFCVRRAAARAEAFAGFERERAGRLAARAGAASTARSRAGLGTGRSPALVIGSGRPGGGGSGGSAAAPCTRAYHSRM